MCINDASSAGIGEGTLDLSSNSSLDKILKAFFFFIVNTKPICTMTLPKAKFKTNCFLNPKRLYCKCINIFDKIFSIAHVNGLFPYCVFTCFPSLSIISHQNQHMLNKPWLGSVEYTEASQADMLFCLET